jgi:hypothetical protein
MTAAEIIALVGALGSLLAAFAAFVASIRNGQKIQEVHLSINSRMDQLLEASSAAARAAGINEEKARMLPTDTTIMVPEQTLKGGST